MVLGKALLTGLLEAGHECVWTQNGLVAVQLVKGGTFDIAVLDLMLPDLPGLVALKEMREHKPELLVLILSALGTVDERVHGLDSGADDYLVKPFAFAELIARLSVLNGEKGQP